MQQDSDLVRAARAASAVTKHTKMPVITNDTLARTGGHMATAAGDDTTTTAKTTTVTTTTTTAATAKNAKAPVPAPVNVTVGGAHLAQPPAPAYSYGSQSMAPDRPAMVSTQAIPTSPRATGLDTVGTYRPGNAGTASPAMVSTVPMPQTVSKPPGR